MKYDIHSDAYTINLYNHHTKTHTPTSRNIQRPQSNPRKRILGIRRIRRYHNACRSDPFNGQSVFVRRADSSRWRQRRVGIKQKINISVSEK